MGKKKVCITFAGTVGSSKSPITNYISTKLDFPVFNNDIIRTEVQEDVGSLVEREYLKRRDERLTAILQSGISFIYDASVDRAWPQFRNALVQNDYVWFIISLDLSKELLLKLYEVKGYDNSKPRLDQLLLEHQNFLDAYSDDIGVRITDEQFADRLAHAYLAADKWLSKISEK